MNLLYRIHQRRESLNSHLQLVAALNRPDAAGCAGHDHVAGQQRHVCRDEAHELVAIEDKLARMRVLPELAVLEKLNGQLMRIDLRLDVRPQRSECVKRLRPRPLAFPCLNRSIGYVHRGPVTKDIPRRSRRRDVPDFPPDDDGQFRLVIRAVLRERDFNLRAVRDKRRGGLEPDERVLRESAAHLTRMVEIIDAYRDDLGGGDMN